MQQGKGILDRLLAAVEPVVVEHGLELVDLAWEKEDGRQYLRVYIDKADGVNLDLCADVSRSLNEPLDALSLAAYFLEVSSPGAERPLKTDRDFERFQGRQVQVKTSEPIEGTRTLKGRLLAHDAEALRLDVGGKELTVPRASITNARLALVMPGPEEKMEGGSRVVEL